jgi:hypothetical protein
MKKLGAGQNYLLKIPANLIKLCLHGENKALILSLSEYSYLCAVCKLKIAIIIKQ